MKRNHGLQLKTYEIVPFDKAAIQETFVSINRHFPDIATDNQRI